MLDWRKASLEKECPYLHDHVEKKLSKQLVASRERSMAVYSGRGCTASLCACLLKYFGEKLAAKYLRLASYDWMAPCLTGNENN